MATMTWAISASVGRPPGTTCSGVCAWAIAREQRRQAYLGRRVTSTRSWAGDTFITPSCALDQTNFAPFQALVNQNDAGLVPDQHLDPVRPFGAEDKGRAAERVEAHRLLNQQRQAVYALAEIRRTRGHVDAQPAGGRDHREAARIARIIRVNCASSMSDASGDILNWVETNPLSCWKARRKCHLAVNSDHPQFVWRNGSILARNNSGLARSYMARLRVFSD